MKAGAWIAVLAAALAGAGWAGTANGADCNSNGVPDVCDLSGGRFPDCDGNGVIDSCDLRHGIILLEQLISPNEPMDEIVAADADGDGDLDLWRRRAGRVGIIRNTGSGRFWVEGSLGPIEPPPVSIAAADFDGDGDAELAIVDGAGKQVRILDDGDAMAPVITRDFPLEHLRAALVVAADVDGDGAEDIIVAHAQSVITSILFNEGGGIFGKPLVLRTGQRNRPLSVRAMDLDGDGRRDVILHPQGKPHLTVFFNLGERRFSPPSLQLLGERIYKAVELGDLDNDGDLDLIGQLDSTNGLLFHAFSSEEGFSRADSLDAPFGARMVRILDLDHDGLPEMLLFIPGSVQAGRSIIAGSGPPRRNMPWSELGANVTPFDLAVMAAGDFDGDGDLDLVAGGKSRECCSLQTRLVLLRNDAPPGMHRDRDWDHVPDLCDENPPPGGLRGDVNGDGGIAIADAVAILEYIFIGIPIGCRDCADIDGDGGITVNDAVRLLLTLFPAG